MPGHGPLLHTPIDHVDLAICIRICIAKTKNVQLQNNQKIKILKLTQNV